MIVFSSHRASTSSGPLNRHLADFDIEVAPEFVPADLHRSADEVRLVDWFPLCAPLRAPAPFRGEAAEHRRFAGTGGRTSYRVGAVRRIPQVRHDVHAAVLNLRGLRILVLVAHVLVDALFQQRSRLGLDPGGAKSREVLARVTVEQQLVMYQRISSPRRTFGQRYLVLRYRQ